MTKFFSEKLFTKEGKCVIILSYDACPVSGYRLCALAAAVLHPPVAEPCASKKFFLKGEGTLP